MPVDAEVGSTAAPDGAGQLGAVSKSAARRVLKQERCGLAGRTLLRLACAQEPRGRAPRPLPRPHPSPYRATPKPPQEQPATSSAGREQLREWLLSGWEPHPDVSWRWRHQEGPRHPRETRTGGSAATPSHMRTRPRRQLAPRPARALHVAPGLGRWLIRLLELTIRLHERACSAQAPRADPRTVAPHRPRGLLAPRGCMRSNARECRYRSVEARDTAAQWLAPSG